jgi:monovalent cation/hydrogen antiporter
MGPVETVLCLLVAVALLATLSRRLGLADPILLVLGGLVLGFIPALGETEFSPEVVFLLFVPPLVYVGAFLTPWRDIKRNMRPILQLAVGLVLATIVAVAVVAKLVVNEPMPWAVAFVLATIVAPPDAVAVMAITQKLKVPRRIVNVLEGESLANDAIALVAYKMAVAAAVSGSFSVGEASQQLLWAAAGGLLIGWFVGVAMVWVRRHLRDPYVQITLSLLTPFAAYLPAEAVHASGVLAVVTTGVYVARHFSRFSDVHVRAIGLSFWRVVEFLLNGLAFIMVGLQLRKVYFQLDDYPLLELLKDMGAIVLTVVVVRIVWVFAAAYLPWLFIPSLRKSCECPPWQHIAVIGWAGIRGVDSLATALAVPFVIGDRSSFPSRNLVIFLSFGVILATLVLQGFTLPLLIRWFKLSDDGQDEDEEMLGRAAAAEAALRRLDELAKEPWASADTIEKIRSIYANRLRRYQSRLRNSECTPVYEKRAESVRRLQLELLQAERQAILDLHQREVINDDVLRDIEHDIDLEELRVMEDDLDHDE